MEHGLDERFPGIYEAVIRISESHHYKELTFSMLYAYSEDFILVFSHDEVVHGKGSMVRKDAGNEPGDKFANLRAAYGFMMGHPGKEASVYGSGLRPAG